MLCILRLTIIIKKYTMFCEYRVYRRDIVTKMDKLNNKNEKLYTRKEMLKITGKSLAGVAMLGALPTVLAGCEKEEEKAEVPEGVEIPSKEVLEYEYVEKEDEDAAPHPYPYQKVDPATAMERAHAGFYNKGGCARAVADGIIGELADKAGYPFNQVPIDTFALGAAGFGAGSLCGSLAGATMAIGLVCEEEDAKKITQELFKWYRETELPVYQPTMELETTVAGSVNCDESVSGYMEKTGAEMDDDIRKERCAALSGDVAGKTVELLNEHFNL